MTKPKRSDYPAETMRILGEAGRSPPAPPPPRWWACDAFAFRRFLMVESNVVYSANVPDPQGVRYVLPVDAPDGEVGAAILDALDHSRFLTPDQPDFDATFGDYLDGTRHAEYDAGLMEIAGVKTRASLYRGARLVGVRIWNGRIEFTAWRERRGRDFAYSGGGPAEVLPRNADAETVGATFRRALELAGS
jgi:hypothetical protein